MKPSVFLACLGACSLLLSGCGHDANGFGDTKGFGGYTKGYGDIDTGMTTKEVGLCSYLGGCMPDGGDDSGSAAHKSAE